MKILIYFFAPGLHPCPCLDLYSLGEQGIREPLCGVENLRDSVGLGMCEILNF